MTYEADVEAWAQLVGKQPYSNCSFLKQSWGIDCPVPPLWGGKKVTRDRTGTRVPTAILSALPGPCRQIWPLSQCPLHPACRSLGKGALTQPWRAQTQGESWFSVPGHYWSQASSELRSCTPTLRSVPPPHYSKGFVPESDFLHLWPFGTDILPSLSIGDLALDLRSEGPLCHELMDFSGDLHLLRWVSKKAS